MTCPGGESLSAWTDGEAGAEESRRVEAHAADCAACRRRLRALAAGKAALAALPVPPMPPDLLEGLLALAPRPPGPAPWSLALRFALAAACGWALVSTAPPRGPEPGADLLRRALAGPRTPGEGVLLVESGRGASRRRRRTRVRLGRGPRGRELERELAALTRGRALRVRGERRVAGRPCRVLELVSRRGPPAQSLCVSEEGAVLERVVYREDGSEAARVRLLEWRPYGKTR